MISNTRDSSCGNRVRGMLWQTILTSLLAATTLIAADDTTELTDKATGGNADAQFRMGQCYAMGKGVEKDVKVAIDWFRKAAGQRHAEAECVLGNCYAKGNGVELNSKTALEWYKKGAEDGSAAAQVVLAGCYAKGLDVEKDPKEAFKWFKKGAEQGNAFGQVSLGWCYASGDGVEKDVKEAVKWFRRAAEQGNAKGQFNLASCYTKGEGVAIDLVEAYKWLLIAEGSKFEQASEARQKMEQQLSPTEIAKAKESAKTFTPKPEGKAAATHKDKVSSQKPENRTTPRTVQ